MSWGCPVAGIRQSRGCPRDQDALSSPCRGIAYGIAVKLQTWLVSRTQPRTSLCSVFNISGNNYSFLLHDIMLNYTSLSLVFRMGYSDSQMIQQQLTPTPECTHRTEFAPLTSVLDCSFSYIHIHTHKHTHLFQVDDSEHARTPTLAQHKEVREYASHNPGDNFHFPRPGFTFTVLATRGIWQACSRWQDAQKKRKKCFILKNPVPIPLPL